ncbi:MAG: protein kinase domain-containing protein [Micromonosporaceae bacterium]
MSQHGERGYVGPEDAPDRYELIERRAAGGEGEVWHAREYHGSEQFSYAVKLIRIDDADVVDRHLEELRLQAALATHLEHPAVVKVKEVFVGATPHPAGSQQGPGAQQPGGDTGRRLYFVMKWIQGRSLQEALERGEFRGLDVLNPLLPIAEAIDYLHSGQDTNGAPVIHRDIKPANVLIGQDGRVYLVDFGLVRLRGTDRTSRIYGTAPFMAPESLARGEYTPATDRYTLGATVYYMLTGEAPVAGDPDGMAQRLAAVLGPGKDREIRGILAMLAVLPEARPASAAGWIRALIAPPMATHAGHPGALPPTIGPGALGAQMPPGGFPSYPGAPTSGPVSPGPGHMSGAPSFGPAVSGGPSLGAAASGMQPQAPQLSGAAGGYLGAPPPAPKNKHAGKIIMGVIGMLLLIGCCVPLYSVSQNDDFTGSGGDAATPSRSFDKSKPPPSVTKLRKALVSVTDITAAMRVGRDSVSDNNGDDLLQGGPTSLDMCSGESVSGAAIGGSETNAYYVNTGNYPRVESAVAGFYGSEAKFYFNAAKQAAGRCAWSEMRTPKLGEQTLGVFYDDGEYDKVAIVFVRTGQVVVQVAVSLSRSYQSDAIKLARAMTTRIPKSDA